MVDANGCKQVRDFRGAMVGRADKGLLITCNKEVEAAGEKDALVAMRGQVKGMDVVAAAFEFSFMGGSMGSVVGEKLARLIEVKNDASGSDLIRPDAPKSPVSRK